MTKKNKPESVVRLGKAVVTVWKNQSKIKDNSEFYTYQVDKSYFVEDSKEWKTSNVFSRTELSDLRTVIDEAIQTTEVKIRG